MIWEWLKDALEISLTSRGAGVTITQKFKWTGANMQREKLIEVQDKVWADPRWKATPKVTHCNQASLAVANGMGSHEFDAPDGGEPYTADQLYNFFLRNSSNYLEKNMEDTQALANVGCLVFAISPSWILQQSHGHICSLTPGDMVLSGSINRLVPMCMNISTPELSKRSVGINYAFRLMQAHPKFFVWKGSL